MDNPEYDELNADYTKAHTRLAEVRCQLDKLQLNRINNTATSDEIQTCLRDLVKEHADLVKYLQSNIEDRANLRSKAND